MGNRMLSTSAWLARARPGFCEPTTYSDSCSPGQDRGAFKLNGHELQTWDSAASACLARCEGCGAPCTYISVSLKWKECSWFTVCRSLPRLRRDVEGFRSGPLQIDHLESEPAAPNGTRVALRLPEAECHALGSAAHANRIRRRWREWAANGLSPLWRRAWQPDNHVGRGNPRMLTPGADTAQARATLSEQDLDASYVLTDATGRLAHVLKRLMARERVQIVALGSSITFGHGLSRANATWSSYLEQALRDTYQAPVYVYNRGQPATQGGFASLCFDVLVGTGADLVVLEYSYTTAADAMQQLVSTALSRGIAVLLLDWRHHLNNHLWRSCRTWYGADTSNPDCSSPTALVLPVDKCKARLGQYLDRGDLRSYGAPLVSTCPLARGYQELPPDVLRWMVAEPDLGHPSEIGQFQMAQAVSHALLEEHRRLAGNGHSGSCLLEVSMASIETLHIRRDESFCAFGRALQHVVRWPHGTEDASAAKEPAVQPMVALERGVPHMALVSSGWSYVTGHADKPGLVAAEAGSQLVLAFNLTAQQMSSGKLNIIYLTSPRATMGRVRVECVHGCHCKSLLLEGLSAPGTPSLATPSSGVKLTFTSVPPCYIRLDVLRAAPPGNGTYFKINALTLTSPMFQSLDSANDFRDWEQGATPGTAMYGRAFLNNLYRQRK